MIFSPVSNFGDQSLGFIVLILRYILKSRMNGKKYQSQKVMRRKKKKNRTGLNTFLRTYVEVFYKQFAFCVLD